MSVELVPKDEVQRKLLAAGLARLKGAGISDERRDFTLGGVFNGLEAVVLGSLRDGEVEDLFLARCRSPKWLAAKAVSSRES